MFTNWKTTLIGCIGAIVYAVLPLVQGGNIVVKDIVIAAVVAAVSFMAKDFDTTGNGVTATKSAL